MKPEMANFSTLKKRMLSDPEARAEYERLGPAFRMASTLIAARRRANLTQQQVADRKNMSVKETER